MSTQSRTQNGTKAWFSQNDGHRTNTSAALAKVVAAQYPSLHLSIVASYTVDLEAYALGGNATMTPLEDEVSDMPTSLYKKSYAAPARRLDGGSGIVMSKCAFGKFHYQWQDHDFIVYVADVFAEPFSPSTEFFVLGTDELTSNSLLRAAGLWSSQIRGLVLVFDGGYWTRSRELYESVMHASWDAVILDKDMKKALIDDHMSFFRSQGTYKRLQVPWKRGVIYHGPPGNGKTISIKATMHMLYDEKPEVPTLYVRSLKSVFGPEDSIKRIFSQARQLAPCYLVFEDLDSIVSDGIRSYFLNEVDGLKENDGIFMVGSTNHLERLDPGISKRPSRFDRKYYFPNPDFKERVAYCKFWQGKLKGNKEIDFPDALCDAVAKITDKFSFAYIQEAFVAALLALARSGSDDDSLSKTMGVLTVDLKDDWIGVIDGSKDGDDSLEDNVLWVEIQKQIEILRQGLEETPED